MSIEVTYEEFINFTVGQVHKWLENNNFPDLIMNSDVIIL